MKIAKTGAVGKSGKTNRKKVTGASGNFAEALDAIGGTESAEEGIETGAVGTVAAVLSLQEVPDATEHPSRGAIISKSEDLLDRLDEIRISILSGSISKEKLTELGRQLKKKRIDSDDPKLNKLIEEIELRAEVEIAKLVRPAR